VVESLARWVSRVTLGLGVLRRIRFDTSTGVYQRTEEWAWMPEVNIGMSLGVDGISRFFVRLNGLLTPLCILASMAGIQTGQKRYYGLFGDGRSG